ncbi:MAG: hypothetical protein ACKOQ1_05035 [Actinomycetota bacterium]
MTVEMVGAPGTVAASLVIVTVVVAETPVLVVTIVTVFAPTLRLIGADAAPDEFEVPLTVIAALECVRVGVTVT